MSHYQEDRILASVSKISKLFTKPPAFTQPQEITFEAPSHKMPRLGRAARAGRGNLSIFRVVPISALRSPCNLVILLPSMIHESPDEIDVEDGTSCSLRRDEVVNKCLGLLSASVAFFSFNCLAQIFALDFLHLCPASSSELKIKTSGDGLFYIPSLFI